jgi:hypothetical protein
MSCGLFSCNGESTGCRTSCQLDAHCIATAYCDPAAMVCGPKLDSGQMCPLGSRQCKSGACADGVCCDKACDAQCESCLGARTGGIDGTCAFIPAGTDPDGECSGSHACNGTGGCD